MKILSAARVREADQFTIKNEPIASIDLMERASQQFVKWFLLQFPVAQTLNVFCGMGNNGGDGLVIARLLAQNGYIAKVFLVRYTAVASPDFVQNESRLKETDIFCVDILEGDPLPELDPSEIVIDALWGSGLNRPIEGFAADVIEHMNASGARIVAVDIPSGLFSDTHSSGSIVKASFTFSFELPKKAFMFPENAAYVGTWQMETIGLHPDFLSSVETTDSYYINTDAVNNLKERQKFDHKGSYGHALLICGSEGKMGAALLAAEACLRAGVGLLTVHVPGKGEPIMQAGLPEAMLSIDKDTSCFSSLPALEKYNAIGLGPGLGTKQQSHSALLELLDVWDKPVVIDADALNILAAHPEAISKIPTGSILTPHPKEFERLLGKADDDFQRNKLQMEFAVKHQLVLILKGAHTAIATPDGHCYFNSSGNPGMATGGSGDVLTGIITALVAQGYSPVEAACLGVYIHGLSADLIVAEKAAESLIAGDLVEGLALAFHELHAG